MKIFDILSKHHTDKIEAYESRTDLFATIAGEICTLIKKRNATLDRIAAGITYDCRSEVPSIAESSVLIADALQTIANADDNEHNGAEDRL